MLIGCLCVFMCAFERARQSRRSVEIEFWRENQSRDDLKLIATTVAPTPVTVSPPFPSLSSPSSLVLLNQIWQTSCFTLSLSNLNTGPLSFVCLGQNRPDQHGARGIHWNVLSDNSKPARSCQLSLLVWSDSNQQQSIQLQGFYRMFFFQMSAIQLRCKISYLKKDCESFTKHTFHSSSLHTFAV